MTLLQSIEALAVLVNALSGFIEARSKKMDVVGVFIVAFITAFGGGTLRDILLDKRPLFWVTHQEYTILIFALSLIAAPLVRTLRNVASERLIVIADAMGLGLLSIVGTSHALNAGMPPFVAVMMGVITGTFGGVLRDIVCNEIPMVLRDGRPYAVCSFVGCWMYLLMQQSELSPDLALWSSALAIFVLRVVTWARDVRIG